MTKRAQKVYGDIEMFIHDNLVKDDLSYDECIWILTKLSNFVNDERDGFDEVKKEDAEL